MRFRWVTKTRPAFAMKVFVVAIGLVVLLSQRISARDGEVPGRLVIGMVPFHEAHRMIQSLDPLADMLQEKLGRPVTATVATSPEALVEALRSRRIDVGFFGPFALVLAEQRADAVVILNSLRDGRDHYRSQFLVRADSDIVTLSDLRGKVWAVPSVTSASGYLFPRLTLSEAGVDPQVDMTVVNMVTHDGAVMAVYYGDADVATTFEDAHYVLQDELPDIAEKVKVLAFTPTIPNDGVVVRKELHPDLVRDIQQALIAIGETDAGRALLTELFRVTGFVEATSERYDIVRRTYELLKDELQL